MTAPLTEGMNRMIHYTDAELVIRNMEEADTRPFTTRTSPRAGMTTWTPTACG